jgi:hypothetical protein
VYHTNNAFFIDTFINTTLGCNTPSLEIPTHPTFPLTYRSSVEITERSDDRCSSHEGVYGNEKAVITP